MDLLFHRYASPFALLDELILAGELSGYISTLSLARDEEAQWEFFLHRVYDQSFQEFKASLKAVAINQGAGKDDLCATVQDSLQMVQGFQV